MQILFILQLKSGDWNQETAFYFETTKKELYHLPLPQSFSLTDADKRNGLEAGKAEPIDLYETTIRALHVEPERIITGDNSGTLRIWSFAPRSEDLPPFMNLSALIGRTRKRRKIVRKENATAGSLES